MMDISGNKRPKNPAGIRSDEAGISGKSIYQGPEDAHNLVPADEDRDTMPYSTTREAVAARNSGDPRADDENQRRDEDRERENDRGGDKGSGSGSDNEGHSQNKENREEKPKDDVHSAPESGDKLP